MKENLILIHCVELAYDNFKQFEENTDFKVSYEELKDLLRLLWLREDLNKLEDRFNEV